MEMDASTLSRNLQLLVSQGWVQVGPAADNRRSRLVSATETGCAKRAEAQREWKRAQAAFNQQMGAERVQRLHALIDECLALMTEEADPAPAATDRPAARPRAAS
jgi:DNA-binding MarR family transcriptional regulator